jgi:SUMO ligase MMS21 Smc5/6 complex component
MSSITEEQLKTLNELLAKKERTLLVIGDLEAQKHVQLHGLGDIEKEFNEFTSAKSMEMSISM